MLYSSSLVSDSSAMSSLFRSGCANREYGRTCRCCMGSQYTQSTSTTTFMLSWWHS